MEHQEFEAVGVSERKIGVNVPGLVLSRGDLSFDQEVRLYRQE